MLVCRRLFLSPFGCVEGPLFAEADPSSLRPCRTGLPGLVDFRITVLEGLEERLLEISDGVFVFHGDVNLGRFGVDPLLLDPVDSRGLDDIGLAIEDLGGRSGSKEEGTVGGES